MIEILENRTLLSGAGPLQGQLLIAKQQALRDAAAFEVSYQATAEPAVVQHVTAGINVALCDGSARN